IAFVYSSKSVQNDNESPGFNRGLRLLAPYTQSGFLGFLFCRFQHIDIEGVLTDDQNLSQAALQDLILDKLTILSPDPAQVAAIIVLRLYTSADPNGLAADQ